MKKAFVFLALSLFMLALLMQQTKAQEDSCSSIGGQCLESCNEQQEEIQLNQPCESGICCKQSTQALVNPEASSSTCRDGTQLNSCSESIKPNFCTQEGVMLESCSSCGCPNPEDICNPDGSCTLSTTQGEESSDIGLVNNPPLTTDVQQITSPFTIDLKLYAVDPEGKPLTFIFQQTQSPSYSSQFSQCTISNSILSCQPSQSSGNEKVAIIASDTLKYSLISINIQSQGQAQQQAIPNQPPQPIITGNNFAYIGKKISLDASKTTDANGDLIFQDYSFVWKLNQQEIGRGIKLTTSFDAPGVYTIELEATDAAGLTGISSIGISILDHSSKSKCRNTTAVYFPQDTICDNKWPSREGELIAINSRSKSCDLIEVCDDGLDFIVEDAIDCCDGTPLTEIKKAKACNFANQYSQGNQQRCQGLYAIKGVGDNAIYMQDYLEAEMCCYGVESICTKPSNLYTRNPLPRTSKQQNIQQLECKTSKENRVLGNWYSDSLMSYNNIALQDLHAGATINALATGTCVDYGVALTTILRKLGYSKDDVFLGEASNHAYTIVRLPLDIKYHIVDTTGNKAPSIILGNVPYGYPYCQNLLNCYNDLGKQLCPEMKSIVGCEGVKEPFTKQASRISFKTQKITKKIVSLLVEEATREDV